MQELQYNNMQYACIAMKRSKKKIVENVFTELSV